MAVGVFFLLPATTLAATGRNALARRQLLAASKVPGLLVVSIITFAPIGAIAIGRRTIGSQWTDACAGLRGLPHLRS